MFPANEAETIELYKLIQDRLGWRIVHLQSPFPDAIIEDEDGERLMVEFEYLSKSFHHHNHDSDKCDLIICWRDNWPDAPLPIQALEHCAWEEANIISRLISFSARRLEWERGRRKQSDEENAILRQKTETLRAKIKQQRLAIEGYQKLRCRPTGTITIKGVAELCIKDPEEYDLCWYFFNLLNCLPNFVAIQNWMQMADIPSRPQMNRILRKLRSGGEQ